jgi:hypothetical protein
MSNNESDIFEENDLYISGNRLYSNINKCINNFNQIFDETLYHIKDNEMQEIYTDLE